MTTSRASNAERLANEYAPVLGESLFDQIRRESFLAGYAARDAEFESINAYNELLLNSNMELSVEAGNLRERVLELETSSRDLYVKHSDASLECYALTQRIARLEKALELALYYVEGDATYEGVKIQIAKILEYK